MIYNSLILLDLYILVFQRKFTPRRQMRFVMHYPAKQSRVLAIQTSACPLTSRCPTSSIINYPLAVFLVNHGLLPP